MLDLTALLDSVARQGVIRADADGLRALAEALWYGEDLPDLSRVAAEIRSDAGYLVDRLLRLGPSTKERKEALQTVIAPFQPDGLAVFFCSTTSPSLRRWAMASCLFSVCLTSLAWVSFSAVKAYLSVARMP